ncbi:MAG: hypothetical protein ACK4J0_01480 [Candidatus Anstonellaceae archaeon]
MYRWEREKNMILNLKNESAEKKAKAIFYRLKKELLTSTLMEREKNNSTKNDKIIRNIYNFAKIGRKKLELKKETFEVLYRLLEENMDYCNYRYLEEQDTVGNYKHWVNKAIIINMINLPILEVDKVLQKVVENKNNSWTIRLSGLTGLFLRNTPENLEVIEKILADKKEDAFIKAYAKKYSLMNKIKTCPKNQQYLYLVEYYKEYGLGSRFNKERTLSMIRLEYLEIIRYYSFSGL